ncbi:O-antigen ligase family protein, partial [Kingella kingae]
QRRLSAGIASALVLFFAATISLTGSRTVFAYILMLTAWLPIYRIIGGRESTRPVIGLALAAFVVLVSQYAVEPMLNWISSTNQVQTAAERMVGSQIEGSGRGYEWRKAWQIFLSAPLFGYGWGSYSLYGFLENVYPTGFRPYENNVLFTHSHNSFLNLLAEMGLVGTTLI